MAIEWESSILRKPSGDLGELVGRLVPTVAGSRYPAKAMAHLMACGGFVSVELTAFERRQLLASPDQLADVSSCIILDDAFETPVVCAARELSRTSPETSLYLYSSDATLTAGYVIWGRGLVLEHAWMHVRGEHEVLRRGEARSMQRLDDVIVHGCRRFGLSTISDVEDLFSSFYGDDAEIRSWVMVEDGKPLPVPREVSSPGRR